MLALRPRYGLDLDAASGAVHPAHGIGKRTGMFQMGMNSNFLGWDMRWYPERCLPHPEHLGLLFALRMTLAMMRIGIARAAQADR